MYSNNEISRAQTRTLSKVQGSFIIILCIKLWLNFMGGTTWETYE